MTEMMLTLDVRHVPELVWGLRREMAAVLRDEADSDANPAVARRLREIAEAFEAGQRPEKE